MGTHTSEGEPNYLQIAAVHIPIDNPEVVEGRPSESGEMGGYGGNDCKINIIQKIPHDGEVNRARYMPSNPDLLATKTVMGPVYIFDRTKHASVPKSNDCVPDLTLIGHEKEGYGLSWHPGKFEGHILSASEDATVCHWFVFSIHLMIQGHKSHDQGKQGN